MTDIVINTTQEQEAMQNKQNQQKAAQAKSSPSGKGYGVSAAAMLLAGYGICTWALGDDVSDAKQELYMGACDTLLTIGNTVVYFSSNSYAKFWENGVDMANKACNGVARIFTNGPKPKV